ncbi:MAG: asparagine synthetase B [Saprospiraceae bacterium]
MKKILFSLLAILFISSSTFASWILIPMDERQTNHLKAYGMTYKVIEMEQEAFWLLNYRGGSFAFKYNKIFEEECEYRNIKYDIIADAKYNVILESIADPAANMDAIKLDKSPKVAVYTPKMNAKGEKIQPWDDAVTLVLTYAEIPYDVIYDKDVLEDKLAEYDWLHLHHEDFTGQYGKFYQSFGGTAWYKENQRKMEESAKELGFAKVSEMKLAVVKKIRSYVMGGGFMFAMCSATDTYDIALAADGIDICDHMYDGDGQDPGAQGKLKYTSTLAFKDFKLFTNPLQYEYSTIDHSISTRRNVPEKLDYFTLFDFSAKWDPVPSMLTQCHTRTVKGFMGQTTAFQKQLLKSEVLILGQNKPENEARYIHSEYGEGFFTFYGGHDPEDYKHYVYDPPTDLNLHPHSPGYRLILNNVLFPAAKKKKRKT